MHTIDLIAPYLKTHGWDTLFGLIGPSDKEKHVALYFAAKDSLLEYYIAGDIHLSPLNLQPNDIYLARSVELAVQDQYLFRHFKDMSESLYGMLFKRHLADSLEYQGFLTHFAQELS